MKVSRRIMMTVAALAAGTALFASVGATEAERIAIGHSGIDDARFVRTERDRDDGRLLWEVGFYADDTEYSYDIDAESGDILKYEWELDWWDLDGEDISENGALAAALGDSGVDESDASYIRVRRDWDDGASIYEVRFADSSAIYEYDIASNGTMVKKSVEYVEGTTRSVMSVDEAAAIALERVPGATRDDMRIRRGMDDGRTIYEGSIYYDGYEYEFEIDGHSGRFLDFERERERWDW